MYTFVGENHSYYEKQLVKKVINFQKIPTINKKKDGLIYIFI